MDFSGVEGLAVFLSCKKPWSCWAAITPENDRNSPSLTPKVYLEVSTSLYVLVNY